MRKGYKRQAGKRFGRGSRQMIWTTTVLEDVSAGITVASIPLTLVLGTDWARAGGAVSFEKGCVLEAIRGWYQVDYLATSTSVSPTWYMAIHKGELDEDPSISNWTTATPYNNEDVLYTDGGHIAIAASTPSSAIHLSRQIDVRAKRKLNTDDTIDMSFVTPSSAQDWSISGVFRCLLSLP